MLALQPRTWLAILIGSAIGVGGIIQGLHWRSLSSQSQLADMEVQLELAIEENELLKRENASLRSLAQGGGNLAIAPELISRAEREMGLHFISAAAVNQISSEELRDRVRAAIESRFGPSGIDDRQDAYRLLGWLGKDDDLLAQLTLVKAVGAIGWFDDQTGEAWVTERFNPDDISSQATLLRLLCRSLLHQQYPPKDSYPGDDEARAREALHRGAAAGAEARFLAECARIHGLMPMHRNTDVEQIFNHLPAFIQGITFFPVIEGKGLADSLHVQGMEVFHATLADPPTTTRAILLPTQKKAPLPVEMPNTAEPPYLDESAGQLGLRLWLEPLGDVGVASDLASHWQADRYLLLPDGEASTALVWDIEMDTPDATSRLVTAFENYIMAITGADKPHQSGQVAVGPDERLLDFRRISPTRLRFSNAATRTWLHQSFSSSNP
ncbi:MAG: hypothetical protein ACO3RV_00320 [Luteolibacter sp.]